MSRIPTSWWPVLLCDGSAAMMCKEWRKGEESVTVVGVSEGRRWVARHVMLRDGVPVLSTADLTTLRCYGSKAVVAEIMRPSPFMESPRGRPRLQPGDEVGEERGRQR